VQSLEDKKSRSRQDLINEIFLLKKRIKNPITMVWIPSHVGIKGNETADRLAKVALRNQNIDINISPGVQEAHEDVNQHVLEIWQREWTKNNKGVHNRSIEPVVSNKCKYSDKKNRAKEVLISRLRLGKCRLNFYLHQIKKHQSGWCDTCKVPETIDHYILQCVGNQIFKKIQMKCEALRIKFTLQNALCIPELIQIIFENTKRKL